MIKLCVDARMIQASGIGTYLQNVLPALSQHFEVTLIGKPEEIINKNIHVIPSHIPIYSLTEVFRFPRLIPSCDVFWSPHYNVPILPIAAKKRLVTIHDIFHLAFFNSLSLKQKAYAKLLLNAAVKLSDHIITVSEFSKSEIIRYLQVNPNKISVIYNGVNHEQFKVITDLTLKKMVQKRYQLPQKFILYVGNVKPHKNLLNLIKAFALTREQLPDIQLVIVGKKEGFITGDNMLFKFLAQEEDIAHRITFTGYVESKDLPVIYNLANLFVFPSYYEGFGLPPLEAMACGCPVLVSDRASMPEICGENMQYFNPDDIKEMAKKIIDMVSAPATQHQALLHAGLQRVSLFTWHTSVEHHITKIKSLCYH